MFRKPDPSDLCSSEWKTIALLIPRAKFSEHSLTTDIRSW